jgi:predicted Zn-dependent protease
MSWQGHFEHLADELSRGLSGDEGFTMSLSAEDSTFVRFNHGRVRQPGEVRQATAALRWMVGRRHVTTQVALTGDRVVDRALLLDERDALRAVVPSVPEDPHLLVSGAEHGVVDTAPDHLPDPSRVVDAVCASAHDLDLVGILASGGLHRGFASHHGQRSWFSRHAALLDWSVVAGGDKAVKMSYGGTRFEIEELVARIDAGRSQVRALQRPSHKLPPGAVRAYLAPAAVGELLDLLAWGAFSLRGQRAGASPLQRLLDGRERLDPRVTLVEDTAGGLGPGFQQDGFHRPDSVPLIVDGAHAGSLVSPRSAVEYGVDHNGAGADEHPAALAMRGGDLPSARALQALDTGVFISNLWYLNHSDRNAGRITGMTRFASFWVEGGQIVAPLDVMRFDDRIYDLFGPALAALTREVDMMPSASTYGERSTSSVRAPGVLLHGLRFTL